MRKAILICLIGLAALLLFARMRLFVRDPLASVSHDGQKEHGAQVYINFANDVLVENDNSPMYVLLLQHGDHVGTPQKIYCLHYLACLTDADVATLTPGGWNLTVDEMTRRSLRYHDKTNASVVELY